MRDLNFIPLFLFSVKYKKQKAVLILLSTNCVVLEIPVIALCGIW